MKKRHKLILGDNIESLRKLPENSIDSVVTDPPYGLSFMNKKWDYDVPSVEFWKEVYRVLKPGGHILSFGGTRTYHRMVVNIEDAGFEIRDQIMWLYGVGFPKSRNIGKDIEKINVGGLNNLKQIGTKKGTVATNHHELATKEKPKGFSYKTASHTLSHSEVATARTQTTGDIPVYEINNEYEGWGTALKPANEPICLARKPLSEKSVAENVLKWKTGGLNIDGCRIGSDTIKVNGAGRTYYDGRDNPGWKNPTPTENEGRFPANIILDETAAELLDEQSGISESKKGLIKGGIGVSDIIGANKKEGGSLKSVRGHNDKGGASRFFYVAKVSKKERNLGLDGFEETTTDTKGHGIDRVCMNEGCGVSMLKPELCKCEEPDWRPKPKKNNHPTVKPINLMTYLCRLITPENGIILDPFMGSASTGVAALLEGFRFCGMEMDSEYMKIATARIENYELYRDLLK